MHCDVINARMIERYLLTKVIQALKEVPAVCLLGPCQVVKTTLAFLVAEQQDAVYLDLESGIDKI
ncbi:MAG: hypothetical protein N3D15_00305 [Syntrophorhabdaceae bacterium]|nr:hypothetical protein [Syntrophorhabdaceae bacterium]